MIEIRGSKLYIGGFYAGELAERFGTPLYVYDAEVIERNYRILVESFEYKPLEILYSVKANNNIEILRIIRDLGGGLDVVSPFEALLGVRLGFSSDKILFTGSSVSDEEMRFVRGDLGIMINIDSLSQLRRYGRIFPETEISLRLNLMIGAGHHSYTVTGGATKFGIQISEIDRAVEIARENKLKISGLHTHIGSGVMSIEPYTSAMRKLLEIASRFRDLDFIDIGGGFGVPYRSDEKPLDIKLLGSTISRMLIESGLGDGVLKLRIEPGRFLTAEAGVLLVRVIDVKKIEENGGLRIFVGVDSGMNHLIRPALYGSYHEIISISRAGEPPEMIADIVGNICESGDVIGLRRPLPRIEEGDILAVLNTGAYGYSMASNYNMRPKPAEIVIYGGRIRLTRRRESFEDLIRLFM
ncbi:MAG: diaminopimelate decarboxylase [Sulfolobales archaeon]